MLNQFTAYTKIEQGKFCKITKIAYPVLLGSLLWLITGCASKHSPLPTPKKVELDKFMGAWFVHGYTPILVDHEAHNAVEHYYLNPKGKVETTYSFRDGGFDSALKTYTPTGFPNKNDASNTHWKMQFIWPFKTDYVIIHVSDDYSRCIIGHPNRKYAWVMDRETAITDKDYQAMLEKLKTAGYDTNIIQRLPQDWSNEQERMKKIQAAGTSESLAKR